MIETIRNLTNRQNSAKGAAGLLVVTLFISNVLGAIRNYVLSKNLPVDSTDTYYAAFRIPDLVLNLLVLGAVSSAFVPVFSKFLQNKDETKAWKVANSVMNLAIICMLAAIILLFLLMPYLIPNLVPHFAPEKIDLTIKTARIMLLSPLFFGVSYLIGSILNSYKRFVAFSISPLVYNLSIILGATFLASRYPAGDPKQVLSIAYGVVVGAFLHMAIQIPSLRNLGHKWEAILDIKDEAVRKIGKLMIPRTIGLGMNQLVLLVITALASSSKGALSYFNYANDIQTMALVVFGVSFANAIFPFLAAAAGQEDEEKFSYYLKRTTHVIITLLMPSTIGLIFLRGAIVKMLLGFNNSESIITTANTLMILSFSLIASGLVTLFIRAFYAKQNSITPMAVGIISGLISIIMAYVLHNRGAEGFAWAYAIGNIVNFILLYIPLRMLYPAIGTRSLVELFFKVMLASLVMAGAMWGANRWTEGFLNIYSRIGILEQVLLSGSIGIFMFLGSSWILRIKEVRALWKRGVES